MDVPNDRSSHSTPTPRGGGIAIFIAFALGLAAMAFQHDQIDLHAWGLLACGLVFLISLADDFIGIPILIRLICQAIAAGLVCIPLFNSISASDLGLPGELLLVIGSLFFLVWLTNLYNFMDGINGIAAIEAITGCLSLTTLYWLSPHQHHYASLLLLTGASLGFLGWNFPRAKLFMGDSGSATMGFLLGMIVLENVAVSGEIDLLIASLILFGVFIVDASFTLSRRLLTGQPFYKPHRSHAYQRIAEKTGSHTKTSLFVGAINLLWLLPIASLVILGITDAVIALAVAYAPLITLCIVTNAGKNTLES